MKKIKLYSKLVSTMLVLAMLCLCFVDNQPFMLIPAAICMYLAAIGQDEIDILTYIITMADMDRPE